MSIGWPRWRSESMAASSVSTTARPLHPDVIGSRPVAHAVDEMLHLGEQRFLHRELRRPHIAAAIGDARGGLLRAVAEGHAAIVHLDLFGGLEIVPDDHLPAAADQRLSHLHGREPVHIEIGDGTRRIEQAEMGHVLLAPADVTGGAGRNRGRLFLQQVVEHRQVVHREIPDHVHVVLEQAEIHPGAVVVVDLAEIAGADDVPDLLDRAGVDEGVIHHQGQVAARGFLDQPARIVGGGGDRLLHDHMLAGTQRSNGQVVMRRDRGGDQHGVHGGVAISARGSWCRVTPG